MGWWWRLADVYKGQVGKKYMGVWWESEMVARMMSRFPNTPIEYMERKVQDEGAAILDLLRIPEEKIQKIVYCYLVPCEWR